MKSEVSRISHEQNTMKDKVKENTDKIKVFKVLPYLVSNVVEVSTSLSNTVPTTPMWTPASPILDWYHNPDSSMAAMVMM